MAVKIGIYIAMFVVLLAIKLWWDLRARKRGRIINHFKSAAFDSVFYIGVGFWLFGIEFGGFVILLYWLRWLLFDLLYNKLTHKSLFYCGDNSHLDEWADELDGLDDNVCRFMFYFKFVGIALTILLIWLTVSF